MNQKELKLGVHFNFDNSEWCEQNQSDDLRGGWIQWTERFNLFAIHFNGTCIYTSRTFSASKKRLQTLFDKWNCTYDIDRLIDTKVGIDGLVFPCKLDPTDTWNGWHKPYVNKANWEVLKTQVQLDDDCAEDLALLNEIVPITIDGELWYWIGELGWIFHLEE